MSDVLDDAADGRPLLEMRGIVKTFPGVRALDGVDLVVRPGEVHCLLGQNGAGKSTLIKVLAGAHRPDEGDIRWLGEPVSLANPDASITLGISTIYQELDLVAGLTVAENIFLGHEKSRGGLVKRAETRKAARSLLSRLGHAEIRADREVGTLPASGQQIVSMARALSHDTRLIVMDEPSAALDQQEVKTLFRVIRDLTSQGVAVVYISHRLEEIRQVGDRVRDGDGLAVDEDLALVGLVGARQHLDQGGLAGAVLTEQAVDLPRLHIEVDAVEGPDAGERLGDAGHGEQR